MKALVTGGAGFIGGHIAEQLVAEGHDVTVLDNLDPFYDVRIKEHTISVCRNRADGSTGSYTFSEGDLRDESLVHELVGGADIVYHQGGVTGVRKSVDHPRLYDEVNVDATLNILEAARDTDVKRIVFASSSSVYGKPVELPYRETHPTAPVSPYGASKLAAESYCAAYHEVYGLPTVALRYFTVYGPRMRPNMAISNFVSRCMNQLPPVIYGDGSQTRDFTYIEDIVKANLALLDTDAADGQAVNVGSSDTIEILTLAKEIRDQTAPSLNIVFDDANDADAEHTHADVSKANDLLDYEPTRTIREGVSEFVNWYEANRDWYESLVRDS